MRISPTPRLLTLLFAVVLPAVCAGTDDSRLHGVDAAELSYTFAAGQFSPSYTPPEPGTYKLPVVRRLSDRPLLDSELGETTLFRLAQNRISVVAFIYTTCSEAVGCPLSSAVMHRIDRAVAADPALAGELSLISISFDPERDTPARMQSVRKGFAPRSKWHFATTRDEAQLAGLLADFDQSVSKLRFADGAWSGLFRHVLKVFLVDRQQRVRNIYSVGFLHDQLVLNDVRTLLLDERRNTGGK